jgi:hypothetical protein
LSLRAEYMYSPHGWWIATRLTELKGYWFGGHGQCQ